MKNIKTYILAAALVAAPVFWAPQAAAVSTYACVENHDPIQFIKMRISYRTVRSDGSIEWKRSPWSPTVNHGKTTCVPLSRAPVGYNFYVEMKDAVLFLSKPRSCHDDNETGAVKRTSANPNASPKFAVFSYTHGKCLRHYRRNKNYTDDCNSKWCKIGKPW